MNIVSKCTIILLSVLACVVLIAFGRLVLSNQDVATVSKKPVMAVSDIAYVPATKKVEVAPRVSVEKFKNSAAKYDLALVETEDVGASAETVWQTDQSAYIDYGDTEGDYEYYSSEDYNGNAPSYDGGGYVNANVDGNWIASSDFRFNGVHEDSSGYSYTWYSENVLPGGGLDIPGRHVNEEGYVCDGDGNLCVASSDLPQGTVVNVPFGTGTAVVYDSGCNSGVLDMYVSW